MALDSWFLNLNYMKKNIHLLLLGLCILTTAYACSKDDAPAPELAVSTESISLSADGTGKEMHIKTNVNWTVVSSESWCTVSPSSGAGTGTIKLTVAATSNTMDDNRSAQLTITAGNLTKQVNVVQSFNEKLVVTQKEYTISAAGGTITVDLQATGEVNITSSVGWITLLDATKGLTGSSMTFDIAANGNIFDREGTISFTLGDLSETVIVAQEATPLTIAADKTGMDDNAPALAAKMGIGWNLGNTLEATDGTTAGETSWGNPKASQTLINAVKAAGFKTIRIPCAWNAYIEDQNTYKIKDSWLERVKEVVDYCVNADMYAIINIHWDGGWLEQNPTYDKQEEVNRKQKALWEQIAVYFRDYGEHLLFAGTNEVHANYNTPSAENIEVQESYNQTFVDAVRSTGGKNRWRNIIVQAYNTNIQYAIDYMTMPVDPTADRIMAEVHYYDPYEFALQETNTIFLWGKDFSGMSGAATWGLEDWADAQFNKMKTNFADKGIPVILGEYGVILRASLSATDYANHVKARNYYLNYITKSAIENGLIPVYWDNGPTGDKTMGLFNRSTGEPVHSDAITAIISAGEGS